MPIYEYNGKRYNIPEAKAQELTARMPGAKLINEAPYYLADNPSPQPPSRAQINVDVPEVNQTTFDGEIARQTAGKQLGGGVSVGQKQNIADITGDMYGNRELTLPDHKNAAQEQEGFWATGLGDALEKLGAGAVRTIAGFGQVGKQSESTMVPGEKIEGDKNKRSEALQGWFGAANTLSERGDRFGVISDPETGETRKKTYADLWKEGKPLAAAGEALLTATESVPTSIMAMLPGGLPLIAVTSAGQKYNEIANNPDTKDLPEWKKILNASASGAIEGLTERLGAKVDMKVFEPVLKKMGEQTVKGILKKGGIGALIQTITEGGEEVISQVGGNVVDYATGVTDEYKPFEGVKDSFVYGAAGGAQFGAVTGAGTIYRAVEQHKANVETAKVQNTLRLWESISKKQSQALPALNNEKQQLEAELGDLTTLSYEEVLNSPESTPELIKARERYDIVNAEYEGVMEKLKTEVDNFISPQVQAIQNVAVDGVITELNIGTEDNPDIVYLTGGKIAINEDGTIDPAGTAPLLTVKNSERKKRLISRKRVVTAQRDDLNVITEGIRQQAYEKLVRPVADKLEGKTHFQNGEQVEYVNAKGETVAGTVTAKQNNTVTVVGIDGKKTETFTEDELAQRLIGETIDDIRTRDVIQVELNGQVYDADVTNIQDGIAELHIPSFPEAAGRYQDVTAAELRRMRVMPQVEGQEQVQEGIKKTDETPENEGSATGRTAQSVSETAETGAESQITPEQQQEQFIASLPKTKEGDIDYDKIEDDDTFITALKSEFPEDAAEIVEEYRKQAQKRLSDADRVQDPVKKKRAQRAAQAQVDRFSNMYERLNPKAQYQARVAGLEEGTIREREAKMGEYLSLRDYLLRNIATGKYKFRWNKNDTDKGLGGELFATKNQETERKKRISFLDNNGYSPESLAELIAESAGQGSEINPGWFSDASQIRDEIIDILLSHDTPTSMIDATTELRKQPETYEEYMENFVDPAVIFEYEANDASQDEMLRSLPTEEFYREISDEEVKIYFGQHISEEEYNNFIYDINNYLNNINFEQNRTQDGIHRNERTRTGGDRTDVGQITGTEKAADDPGRDSGIDGSNQDEGLGGLPTTGEAEITGERSAQDSIEQSPAEGEIQEPGRPAEGPSEWVDEQIDLAPNVAGNENIDNFVTNKQKDEQPDETRLDNRPAVEGGTIGTVVGGQPQTVGIDRTIQAANNAGDPGSVLSTEELEELESRDINPYWDKPTFLRSLKAESQKNGVWLDESYLSDKELVHDQKATGTSENDVYVHPDRKTLTKLNNLSYVKGTDRHNNLNSFIDRINAHNALFPDLAYTVIGFMENKNGSPAIVLEQPFISNVEGNATQEEINDYLTSRGFKLDGTRQWSNEHQVWTNGVHELFDARPANVLKGNDGQFYFVDTFPHSVEYMTQPDVEGSEESVNEAIEAEAAKVDVKPTEAQKEAGNYKKGHVTVSGFDITIDNPKGSERSGTDTSGRKWTRTLKSHYGYFKRTQGKDGDQIDVFIGENPESRFVFVVDQLNQDGSFDEHKVMLGYDSFDRAKEAYLENYEEGWQGLGAMTVVEMEDFRKWLDSDSKRIKPFSEYKQIQETIHETDGPTYEPQTTFIGRLKEMYPNGLKLYHRTSIENYEGIKKSGFISPSKDLEGVHTVLGDPTIKRVSGDVLLEIHVPVKNYENLYPEENTYYINPEDAGWDRDYTSLMFKTYMESHPELIGGDIVYSESENGIPMSSVKRIDASETGPVDIVQKAKEAVEKNQQKIYSDGVEQTVNQTNDKQIDSPLSDQKENIGPKEIDVEGLFGALRTKGEARLSDHVKPQQDEIPAYGANNKIITQERYNELREQMRKKLNNLNVGFDPEVFSIGAQMAMFHIESGAHKFADFAKRMVDDLGDAIRPYLKASYEGARAMPGMEDLSKTMDSYNDVLSFDVKQSFEEQQEGSQQKQFTFKQETPISYGKAMKILEKRYRYPDGKVMTRYEWIESLPHGLEVRMVKVAAKNDEGYREELWLNQTTITKTEQDYYEYLQQGGVTISDHLADEERKAIEEERIRLAEKKANDEEKRKQNEIAQAKQDQNRKDTIVAALQSTRDEFIEIGTQNERDYVDSFNNRRRKDNAYERDLAIAKNNLEARENSARKFYDMAKSIYTLDESGNPVRKYNYKVGDKVVVTSWAKPVETVIQDVKGEGENAAYVVEKRDGIYNQHVHYDSMRPVEKDTITKEQYESFDTRGYTYAVVKDGKVVTRGSNPILAKEPMPIKSLLDIADNLNGDLYIAPTSGQPIDTRSADDVIIGGLTWQQILDKQQGKSINLANELKMPENAVLFPKYEQLYQNDLVENDVPLDSQPIDIVQKAKDSVENDRKNKPQAQGKSTSTPVEKIEDFGEKIGGARKDLAQEYKTKLSEIKEDDIRSKPLSKIFPRLDLKKLVENGDLTQDDALYLNYRYDKIPTKPRVTGGFSQKRKLDKWINDVQKEIKLAHAILSQEKSFGHLDLLRKTKLEENAGYRYFQNGDEIEVTPEQRLMLNDEWMHIKALKALGFPTSGVKMGNAMLQYRVHSGEQYIVKVNNKRSIHITFEDAVDYLRNELEKPTNRETVFNIYQNRKSGKYFIGKPIQGKEPIQLSEWFDTQKEVTAYFRDNRDEVQAKWDAMSLKPEERRSENRERKGRDWRNGKDVTPDQFQSEFGFRGTEFGNWVNQQERQYALNNAYDALMDLSSVLDISPRALSLNGELGMAFGARGTGNAGGSTASAHYESAKVVINLTKKSGAGSLAHEWWHALDNYFARIGNKSLDFATDGTKGLDTNVREEMKQAFNDIVDAIKKSGLPKRSGELDKTRSKPYWATNVEMSARAFENYVIKSLSEKGDSNDYLANFKELSDWATVGSFEADSYPYPTQEESHYINEKFQQFFDTIQEKVDEETGNTILFRKVDDAGFYSTVEDALRELAPNGMPLFRKKDSEAREAYAMREWNRAKTAISKLSEKMGLDVEIMETTEGLPKGKAESKGWYDVNSKKITIVMPNHTSSWDAQATLLHEAVGHHGLRELFGEHFDTFLDNVYNNAEEGIKDQIDRIGGDTRRATDEYLSRLAEDQEILQTDRLRGFFNEVRKFFFEMLAKLGFNPGFKLSENELKYILWRSYQNLSEPGRYRSIAGHAKDVAMQHSLKVGNYAEKEVSANVVEDPGFIAKKLNQAVFDQLSNDFENATTLEEKHTAAETIIRGIERVIGNDYSNVAQTHEDLIRLSPKLTEEQKRTIRSGRVVGYFDGRSIHLDVESIDTAHELIAAWFHENGHRIIREEFSGTEFEDLYESIKNIDDLNYFLPDFYINETAAVKGEEMITHGVGIVVSNNSLEDVVNNNIDYGNMPAQLRKFVETIFNKLHDEQIQKREHNTRQIWESGLSTDAGQGDGRRIPGDTETSRRTFGEDRQGNDIERRSRKDSNVSDRRINIEGTVGDLQVIKDRSISNGTFMKAPNGKHTNLTERQWLQVRTKEFMAWFGDWMNDPASASKIVDENGEPLVVYHGTTVDFTEFKDVVKKGMITTVANGYGYFFTPSKDIASKFGDKIMPVYLKIENPKNIGKGKIFSFKKEWFGSDKLLRNENRKNVEEEGYDGFYLPNISLPLDSNRSIDVPQYVVFSPSQIKSVDNVGTFDPENDDIRFRSDGREKADTLFDNIDNLKSFIPNYSKFLNDVLQGSPAKSDIIANAREKGFTSMPKAIEEYLANVEDPAELSRIKELLGVDMPDNALRYMLWRNANPDDGTVVWKAKEAVKTNELDENILFRKGEVPSSIKNDKYEQRIRSRHNRGFRSLLYGIEEGWLDRMASLRIIQDAITGGKAIPDRANAYMLENQLSSRNGADIRYFTKNLVDPLLDQIHKIFGIDRNAADEYMNAKHGLLERNDNMAEEEAKRKYAKKIAALNKELSDGKIDEEAYNEKMEAINGKIEAYAEKLKEEKDYSGLTAIAAERGREDFKAVAHEIVAEVEGRVSKEDIDDLWRLVNKATKWVLDKQYNAGIMTKETYEKIRNMYKYYVPLRGFEEVTATDLYEYIDNSPSNFEGTLKTAHGRTSRAESPTATIMGMGESAIMQANRNRMKQAFYRLVATNPSNYASIEDVWFVKTADGYEERFPKIDPTASADEVLEAIADFNNEMEELAAEGQAFQGRNKLDVGVKIMKAQASEHVVRVWVAGEEKVIFINGNPRAAQAINGLLQKKPAEEKSIRHGVEYWSRQMAANFTSRNPAFMVTNLMRDIQFAVISAAVKEGIPYSMQLAKNITLVGKTISANVFKDGNKDNAEFQKYWEEFEANGGETGYANLHSIDYNKKYVKKKLREFSDQRDFLKPFRMYVEFMEKGNRTIEDMSRFATYVTSRQMGRSIERSVSDAKEITINFNKSGSGGFGANLIHLFYLFANPALQSMRLLGMMAKNHPVRFTAMLSSAMSAGFMVPMINELLLELFGDDDDKEKYRNITPWVRRNNLVLYVPGTKDKFVTLMLPHELRAFYGIGEMAYEKANGGLRRENMAVETAKQMTAMLPIDPMGGPDWWVPDALKPPYQAYVTNRNFMDRPIYRKSIWNEHDPEWTKAYRGTPELLVEAAKGASDITGGDDVVPGWANANPARAYHLFSGYLGGFMTTYTDMSMIAFNLLTGRDVRANDVPVVNKLIRTSDEKTEELRINSEYFYYIDWIREYEHRTKGYEKRVQDPEYRDKYMDVMRDKEQRMYNFAKGQIAVIDQLKDYDEEKANEMKEQFVRKMWEYEDQD